MTPALYPSQQRSAALLAASCSNPAVCSCTRGCGEEQQEQQEQLSPGLQPLLLWMANSIELLHFIQHQVPQLLPWRQEHQNTGGPAGRPSPRSPNPSPPLGSHSSFSFPGLPDAEVSLTRAACEEAMTVLEEVIMFTFQQSVYYLTKVREQEAGRCHQSGRHDGGMAKRQTASRATPPPLLGPVQGLQSAGWLAVPAVGAQKKKQQSSEPDL